MSTLYVSNEAEKNWLTHAKTDLGDQVSAHLWADAGFTPGDGDVLATFTAKEAGYSGYSAQVVNLDTVVEGGDGRAYTLTDTITFPVSGASPETVHGVYYTNALGTQLLGAIKFNTPVTINGSTVPDPYQQKFTLRQEPL